MNDKMQFQFYFEVSQKLFRIMVYCIFLYPLFVAASETFQWSVFHYLNSQTVKLIGTIFMAVTIAFFPLSYLSEPFFARNCSNIGLLGRRLLWTGVANMALSELITLFGLVIYITSADLKYFYLFFIISFVHLISVRPTQARWQKRLNGISHD